MTIRRDIAPDQRPLADLNKHLDLDVVIVGAGISGIYLLYKLRELGYKVKIFEAGTGLGGAWHWNCYPGAPIDSPVPICEYSIKECWKNWNWKEKYPGWEELREYFKHVDKQLDITKDVLFNTRVVSSQFDQKANRWNVETLGGPSATSKYLLLCSGFSAKRYFPDWKGLDAFKGIIHHSSFWPDTGVDVRGKRVAVIGTGSTGIQLIQELAPDAKETFIFQRTPNLCLPMCQEKLTAEQQEEKKKNYPEFFRRRMNTFGGLEFDWIRKNTFDVSPEEREKVYEKLWQSGGFEFWVANFQDLLFDLKANRAAYDFWAKKTRARITHLEKRDLLAPLEPPHPFGTKRPSLEQNFYEICNQENVHVVNTSAAPIEDITESGIRTADGKHYEVDVIAIATGFDSLSGGMKSMGLRDMNGVDLADRWADGTTNISWPHNSGLSQYSDIIVNTIRRLGREGKQFINPKREAEKAWSEEIQTVNATTLFPLTESWYMGANIPGKKTEQLNYIKGLPVYDQECRKALENFTGFVVA